MIPYKSSLETAVPKSLEVRREILKAMQTLAGDQDERLEQRRAEIASIRRGLEQIAQDIANLHHELPLSILSELRKYGYNPDEPRVPKGSPGPGRWTRVAANDDPNKASDSAEPDIPFQKYGRGHHWVPRKVFQKRDFSKETKAVFENATSGPLADPKVNSNSQEHIQYNKAVNDLLDDYLKKTKITADQMTPAQAEEFVEEMKTSIVPAIRNFIIKINREVLKYGLRYGPSRRWGGGDDE